jgi:hypothetical protein
MPAKNSKKNHYNGDLLRKRVVFPYSFPKREMRAAPSEHA